ncbi:MAG: hypothetical protein ACJ748_01655 [Flavisolibacter sp.]
MKKILLSVFTILFFTASYAQFVPDSIVNKQIDITLKGKHHGFIYALMPDKGSVEARNYANQLAKFKKPDNSFDTAQLMTVTVSYSMVASMYFIIGSQQERLASVDNAEIKDALIPQLMVPQYLDLLQAIMAIGDKNKAETETIRTNGINQIIATNL